MGRWQHAKSDSTHPCEPRHGADGKWVCSKCREPVTLDGAKVDMTWKGLTGFDVFAAPQTPDPDEIGLQNEGS